MKKFISIFLFIFLQTLNINANDFEQIKRITVGQKNAKITILAYESLTCSHCADFHINVYPILKKDYIDTGLAKIEFRHFPLDIAAFNASKISQCKNDGESEVLNNLYLNCLLFCNNKWTFYNPLFFHKFYQVLYNMMKMIHH